jgi:hypothetical protein
MRGVFRPGLEEIESVFTKEVAPYGGTIWDRFCEGQRLYVRSVYPQVREVLAGDHIQRGVALRVLDDAVVIYPYLFRQSGQNGAILAGVTDVRQIQRVKSRGTAAQVAEVLAELGRLVHACSDEMILQNAIQHLRLSTEVEANVVARVMPLLASLPQHVVGDVMDRITVRFHAQRNHTLFELLTAVSAVARETADPATRWRLEELGGSLFARRSSRGPIRAPRARRALAGRR